MDKNTLTEISQNKEFIKKLLSQETDEGFKDVLGEKDINVSLEDAKEIRMQVISAIKGNVNLTEKELEIINGGKTSVGDAIKYTVKVAVALTVVAAAGKVGYDIYDDVSNRKTPGGIANSAKYALGGGSAYDRGIHKAGDAIIGVAGGKGEEDRYHDDIKHLTASEEKSEKIVKGFGLKNGKLF